MLGFINRRSQSLRYLSYLTAGLFSFYNLLQLSLLNVMSPIFLSHLQLTTISFSLFSACFLWANALGLVPIGLLVDRYSIRWLGLGFLSLTTASCFVLAFSHSFFMDVVMRIFQGLASAASLLISMRLATQLFKSNDNLAIGTMVTLALSGGVFGNYVFAHMVHRDGLQISLSFVGLIGVMIWGGNVFISLREL